MSEYHYVLGFFIPIVLALGAGFLLGRYSRKKSCPPMKITEPELKPATTAPPAPGHEEAAPDQSQMIDHASRLFDELKARGLIEGPRYKLAPLDSVPPKTFSHRPPR